VVRFKVLVLFMGARGILGNTRVICDMKTGIRAV